MQYAYTAKSMHGETSTGVVVADSLAQAQKQLREKGLYMVSAAAGGGAKAKKMSKGRVSKKDLVNLTSQLAIMTRAGIDIAGALQSLAKQATNATLKNALDGVYNDVMGGRPVSAAMKGYPAVFDNTYVASIAAGEASGKLPEVLDRLAQMQRAEMKLISTRRTLMAYPIILTSVSTLVILGLMFFVIPQFSGVFAQFNMALPAITQVLLTLSDELRKRWWLWIGATAGAIAGLRAWKRSPGGRRWCDRTMLYTPPLRELTRCLMIGRAFRLLGIMIESGVPLIDCLRLTRASISNSLFQELFDGLEREVLNGHGLADALGTVDFMPAGATEMISTAERTGTLGMVTQVIGQFYEEEGETRLRELASLVEPIIICVMGSVVACVVLAVMLPMFDFATMAQHGK
jgi:type II secretory pathway component PulF